MQIAEIFESIQGEGPWAGTQSLFIRTSGCNLRCVFWCALLLLLLARAFFCVRAGVACVRAYTTPRSRTHITNNSQNWDISQRPNAGFKLAAPELADWMLRLQDEGRCHNINLVTPEHVAPQVRGDVRCVWCVLV